MTWIVAKKFVSGYAAMFSDVQVTWGSGSRRENCLRKVYAMAPNIACGFSGSVEVGFKLLADMRMFAVEKMKNEEFILPRSFAFDWYRRGKRIYSDLPDSNRQLGCSLILAGCSPLEIAGENTNLRRSDIIIMRSGDGFTPKMKNTWEAVSIGSGSTKKKYMSFLKGMNEERNSVSMENADIQPGRAGETMALLASVMMKDNVEAGVSPYVHCTLVSAFGVQSFPLNFSTFQGEKEIKHQVPKVAETYSDFKAFEKSIQVASAEAIG